MRRSFSYAVHAVAAAALAAAALVPAHAADLSIYNGEAAADLGLALGGWGSGSAEETTEEKRDSERSLKIVTRDFYQGGRIDLQKTLDLAPVISQPNAYLALTVKMSPAGRVLGTAGAASAASGYGGAAPGGPPPGYGGGPGGTSGQVQLPRVSKLRVLLIGPNDASEAFSVGDLSPDEQGWANVGIPLDELASRTAVFPVRRIIISADVPDTLYVSRLAAVNDNSGITSSAQASQYNDIQANRTAVTFSATAKGGITPLRLTWDFDASNGTRSEDAVGATAQHTFLKAGRYTVTLTVSPLDSSKKRPSVETLEIDVVP